MNRMSRSDKVFGAVITVILILICVIMLYPMYFTVIASVSDPAAVATGKVSFYPKGFTMDGYLNVFKNDDIWRGYKNSIINTVLGTLLSLVLTIPAGFALSQKKMRGHSIITTYFVFTMFFSGGMLPSFLIIKNMGLINKPYTLIVLGALSVYNVIVTRTFFTTSIPSSLYEAAEIDGCSQFGLFFRIALPLSKPIIAVMALYYAVGEWQDYFTSLIYVTNRDYYPLQAVLRGILLENQSKISALDGKTMSAEEMLALTRQAYLAEAMKYAVIFLSSLPMLVVYPFVQKHFVKGILVGSVKG